MYGRNLKAYQKTTVTAEISVADPYYVTKLLFQGVFERLAQAKGAIELKNYPQQLQLSKI